MYFSEQRGLRKGYGITELRVMVRDLYNSLVDKEFLKEWLGYYCVDAGNVDGSGGSNPGSDVILDIGRSDIWPPDPVAGAWTEDAIFDFLQFLGTKISSSVEETGRYHGYNNCGLHDENFTAEPARNDFIVAANRIISRYGMGWEMKSDLQIVEKAPVGTSALLTVDLPSMTELHIQLRVQSAVDKFRRRSSNRDDRRDAVRNLGDVLEWLKEEAKEQLGRNDASDLFNILNNFGIRHNNKLQKDNHDPIWLSGLFYHFLTMIHVLTHLIERSQGKAVRPPITTSERTSKLV